MTDFTLTGEGPVRRLLLDAPQRRNAQTVALWAGLEAATTELAADPEVRCLVVSGAGETFSAGLDLAELGPSGALRKIAALPDEDAHERLAQLQHAFLWPQRMPYVVVAAVEGAAVGAGFELALACDVRIVAADARLRPPEVSMGVVPDLGGCHRLVELVGPERTLDLLATGRELSGREAAVLGVALRVVAPGEADAAALAYGAGLAGLAPGVLPALKRALAAGGPQASLAAAADGMLAGLRRLS